MANEESTPENIKKQIENLGRKEKLIRDQKLRLENLLKSKCVHPKKYLRFKVGWFPSGEDASIGYTEPYMPERWCALCGFREDGEVSNIKLDKWDHSWIPDSLAVYKILKGRASLGEDDSSSKYREKIGKEFLSSMTG